jgi:hypothetical protein
MWRLVILFISVFRRLGVSCLKPDGILPESIQLFLRDAESIEVFSLAGVTSADTAFLGAVVLGSVVVEDRRTRKKLINRILLANHYNLGGFLCLGAEYGVRARIKERTLDMTFCFDCSKVWVTSPNESRKTGTIAGFPSLLMNKTLKRAGIPLPPRQEY